MLSLSTVNPVKNKGNENEKKRLGGDCRDRSVDDRFMLVDHHSVKTRGHEMYEAVFLFFVAMIVIVVAHYIISHRL